MKNLFLAMILVSTSFTSFSQEPKLKKVKENGSNGPYVYYVLKDNPAIKHGEFIQKPWGGPELLVTGQYDMGKKTGLWTERYYAKGLHSLKSKGNYDQDEQVGKWVYFNAKEDTVQVYDYDSRTLIYSKLCSESTSSNDPTSEKPDCLPEYIGGINNLVSEIQDAILNNITELGTREIKVFTKIKLSIDENGELKNVEYSETIDKKYSDRIESCLYDSDKIWIAAMKDGKAIQSSFVFPMGFHYRY